MIDSNHTKPAALVIGVGNPMRRDDGAGPAVVRSLLNKLPKDVAVIEHHGDGLKLLQIWQDIDKVVLVDAAFSGALPGTIFCFDGIETELPARIFSHSSHLIGVVEAVEMARALGRLPEKLIVYGIEGATFDYGDDLSDAVADAVKDVASKILSDVAADG